MTALWGRGPFPPSWVCLGGCLVGTMGKAEVEQAATLLVRACAVRGDRWQPRTLAQVVDVYRLDFLNRVHPFSGLELNPFFNPDFLGLVARGFARMEGEGFPENAHTFELTDAGVAALERWTWPHFNAMHAAAAVARGDLTLRRMDGRGETVLELALDLHHLGAAWTPEDLEPMVDAELGVAHAG